MKLASVLFAIVFAIAAMSAYVGGYFLLTSTFDVDSRNRTRNFEWEWEARIFGPAIWVESLVCGIDVHVGVANGEPFFRDSVIPEVE